MCTYAYVRKINHLFSYINLARKMNFLQNLPYCQWLLLVILADLPNSKILQISILVSRGLVTQMKRLMWKYPQSLLLIRVKFYLSK